MSELFTPTILATLIRYNPETGVMTWRPRSAELYQEMIPGLAEADALDRSDSFNRTWAGKVVGTDRVTRGVNRRIRISMGPGAPATRKTAQLVAWMIGSGRNVDAGKEIITWDGDAYNMKATNIIETTSQVRRILENPSTGLKERVTGRWSWVIGHEATLYRGVTEGYETAEEARAARDATLNALGLDYMIKLSDVLNG